MIGSAAGLAGWRWLGTSPFAHRPGAAAAELAFLLLGLGLLGAAALFDARTASRVPLSRRDSTC